MIEQQIILTVVPGDYAVNVLTIAAEFDTDHFGYNETIIKLNSLFDVVGNVFTDEQGNLFDSEDLQNIFKNEQ